MATGKAYRVPKRILTETVQSGLFCLDLRLVAVILQNFRRLYWDATWVDNNGHRSPLNQLQRDTIAQWEHDLMTNLTECLGDELGDILNQLNEIQNNQTQIINTQNNHSNLLNQILEEVMGDVNITFNPTITINGGCGGSVITDPDPIIDPPPTDDPPPDNFIMDDPPSPNPLPAPTDDRCPASWLLASYPRIASNFFTQRLGQPYNVAIDTVTAFYTALGLVPLAGYTQAMAELITSLFGDFGQNLIIKLEQTERERACLIYNANSPYDAWWSHWLALANLTDDYNEKMWLFFINATIKQGWDMLADLSQLVYPPSNNTYGAPDYSQYLALGCPCDDNSIPPEPSDDPYSDELLTTIDDLSLCLIEPDSITDFMSLDPDGFHGISNTSFEAMTENAGWVRVRISGKEDEDVGIIFMMQTDEPVQMWGNSHDHILNNSGIRSSQQLKPVLIGNTLPPELVGHVEYHPEFLLGGERELMLIGHIGTQASRTLFYGVRYIRPCNEYNRFYLNVDSNYLVTPDNWSVEAGQTFFVHNNVANDGTPTHTIPNVIIESGLIVDGSAVKFINWNPPAPRMITLKAYRIANPWYNSPKLAVLVRNHGDDVVQSRFELDMVNENEVYTLETPLINNGTYDIEIIGTGDGGDAALGNVVVFDIDSQ